MQSSNLSTIAAGLSVVCALFAAQTLRAQLPLPATPAIPQVVPTSPAISTAQAAPPGELTEKLRRRGDITLSNTSLKQALMTIGQAWGVNIVIGDKVEGEVNGAFQRAPLHEILHSILYANGYGYRVVGQGLVILPLEGLGEVNPLFEMTTISLRHANPADLVESAKLISSPQGRVESIPSANSLLVVDLPERVKMIRTLATQLDGAASNRPTAVVAASPLGGAAGTPLATPTATNSDLDLLHFKPQYISAETARDAVASLLSEAGKATLIPSENRVVVIDYPANLALVARVAETIDVPRPQVRITALIYDVSVEDMERLGFNWSQAVRGSVNAAGVAQDLVSLDTLLTAPVAATDPSGALTFMTLTQNFDLTAAVEALATAQDSQLLADPRVTVEDREDASIQIVTEIPFQELTQTAEGGSIGTTSFREAGVKLSVKPYIANDSTVRLEVTPTFSRLAGFTQGESQQPIIDKREAKTTVRVLDGQTLVIGGLRQRTEISDRRGIPYLKDIGHIGALFRGRENTIRESELLVFIRTEIIGYAHAGRPREQSAASHGFNTLDQVPVWGPGNLQGSQGYHPHAPGMTETIYPHDVDPHHGMHSHHGLHPHSSHPPEAYDPGYSPTLESTHPHTPFSEGQNQEFPLEQRYEQPSEQPSDELKENVTPLPPLGSEPARRSQASHHSTPMPANAPTRFPNTEPDDREDVTNNAKVNRFNKTPPTPIASRGTGRPVLRRTPPVPHASRFPVAERPKPQLWK